jgi:hypothetical protein
MHMRDPLMTNKPAKRLSRRQALRRFTSEQKKTQAYPYDGGGCRRMTAAEASWWMTKEEVDAEFRWARHLHAVLDELAAFRESGRCVN